MSLWLTGEAAWFGVPGRAEEFSLPEAAPLADLLARGRRRRARSRSARSARPAAGIAEADLRDGVRIAGSAAFAEEILVEGAQALVY